MAISVRTAVPADADLILRFIRDLARYEKAPDEVTASTDDLRATLFGPDARAHVVIASLDDRPVGFAVYFFSYSTWQGQYGIYLEDLYVDPEFRRHGAGSALVRHLARLAVEHNCGRFEWSVLDWNTPAIRFYEAMRARPQAEWVRYRLTGDDLRRVAAGD